MRFVFSLRHRLPLIRSLPPPSPPADPSLQRHALLLLLVVSATYSVLHRRNADKHIVAAGPSDSPPAQIAPATPTSSSSSSRATSPRSLWLWRPSRQRQWRHRCSSREPVNHPSAISALTSSPRRTQLSLQLRDYLQRVSILTVRRERTTFSPRRLLGSSLPLFFDVCHLRSTLTLHWL